jgi:hypothetical protein
MDFRDLQYLKSLFSRYFELAAFALCQWRLGCLPWRRRFSCIDQKTLIHQTDDWALLAQKLNKRAA